MKKTPFKKTIPKYADEFVSKDELSKKDIERLDELIKESSHNVFVCKDVVTLTNKKSQRKVELVKLYDYEFPLRFMCDDKLFFAKNDDDAAQIMTKNIFNKLDSLDWDINDVMITIKESIICRYRRDMINESTES